MKRQIITFALLFLATAAILFAQNAKTLYLEGLSQGKKGNFKIAGSKITAALKITPSYTAAKRGGDLLHDLKKGRVKPETARLLFEGLELFATIQWKKALKIHEKALALQPDYYFTLHNTGCLFYLLNSKENLKKAMTTLRKALAKNPRYPYTHHALAIALAKKGRINDAKAAYKRAISLAPQYPNAYYNLSQLLFQTGKLEDGRAILGKALIANPTYQKAFHIIMETPYHYFPLFDTLIPVFIEFLEKHPQNTTVFNNLIAVYKKTGSWKKLRQLRHKIEASLSDEK
ncbi:MAG: tetratricopeptide repeat protein [bacterium]|nr:tetratricopeptide repeat protein [bacterium]